jgi:hypothetical protein
MPRPTYEELEAQVMSLRAQLQPRSERQHPPGPTYPVKSSLGPIQQPTADQEAIVRRLLVRPRYRAGVRDVTTDPVQLQAAIDAVQTIIYSGVNSAGYGDKRTEFRSLAELRQILFDLLEDQAALAGAGGRIRQIRMTTYADKGL